LEIEQGTGRRPEKARRSLLRMFIPFPPAPFLARQLDRWVYI